MSVTVEQVFEEVKDWYSTQTQRYGMWDALEDALYDEVHLPSGALKRVAQHGGEGEGDTYYYVFSIGEQLFRVDGYYASWDGVSYDDSLYAIHEVEAVPTTVIKYNRK
ncbi:hypothetical protein SEA_ATUIN_148 [Arthrobacter phage Atuin]|nr:hypothetical protein SEA_ATUIN_247 [Arthrobacter phage Atuin]